MLRKLSLFAIALMATALVALAGPYTHFAYLNGYQETPPVLVTSATGMARCELVGDDLYYTVWYSGLTSNVSNGHFHAANVGVAGGVVHGLQNLTNTGASGVWNDLTPAQIASLNAHGLYINIHTVNHGGGEIRGQVLTRGTCIASLDPMQEVQNPAVVSNGRGFGWFRLNAAETNLEYAIAWAGLNAPGTVSAAHFHKNVVGQNAGVLQGLSNITNISAGGNWALSAQNVIQLEAESLYVNVHTPAPNYPSGEIRGQVICVCVPEDAFYDANAPTGSSQCITLCPELSSKIRIINIPVGQYPVVTKRLGCTDPCNFDCEPATYIQEFFGGNWQYTNGVFWLEIRGDGCICVTFDDILPVELSAFDAIAGNGEVTVNWRTSSETELDRFEVLRDGSMAFSVSAENSASGASYSWTDSDVDNGTTYFYTLVAVNLDGSREELMTESATPQLESSVVSEFALHQNYPNPFNPETSIAFSLPVATEVELRVFNSLGQEVAVLAQGNFNAGTHTVRFDGSTLTSGLYFYSLKAGEFSAQSKMLLLK